jgi:site-specific recombinase XerD
MAVSFSLARPKAIRSSIRVKVSVSGVSIFLYTGRSIETCHWDKKKCFVRSYVGRTTTSRIIMRLKELEVAMLEVVDEYKNGKPKITFLQLQEKLQALIDNPLTKFNKNAANGVINQETLTGFAEQFIADCESGVRLSPKRQKLKASAISSYRTTLGLLTKFQTNCDNVLHLSYFNQQDIDRFSDFMIIEEEYAMNTHSKVMMDTMQFFKYAGKLKKIPPAKLVELEFDTRREDTDSIYLTESEILELMKVSDFESPIHEHVRDVFVIGCFTGMRFSDYSVIDPTSIRNNRLEIVQKKTGNKVTIPIHSEVVKILEKYNYLLPQVPPNNEFNRIIKIVGEKLPSLHTPFTKQITYGRELKDLVALKYTYLQTHTARRSFCSNEYLKGTDPMIIMAISGHKSHKSFMRYIKVSGDEFAAKLEKIWAERQIN